MKSKELRDKEERAITLVALIITIVILLILAVTAIATIKNGGIILKTEQATFMTKVKNYEEELVLYINDKKLENLLNYDETTLTADKTTDPSITDIIKSMDEKDEEKFVIQEGKLKYIGDDWQEKEWSNNLGLKLASTLKIYGNSVQDGTPTPDTPIEIQSVGDKTKNLFNYKDYIQSGKTKEIDHGIQFEITGTRIEIGIDFTFKANTTYVISAECTGDAYFGGQLVYDFSAFSWCNENVKSLVFENSTDTDVTKKIICVDTTGTKESTIKFAMLEINTMKTDYEPYGYKIPLKISNRTNETITNIYLNEPLRKVGDVEDYIDFSTGKVIRKIKEQVITGEENVVEMGGTAYNGETSTNRYISLENNPVLNTTGGTQVALTTHLEYSGYSWVYDKIGFCTNTTNQFHLRFLNTTLEITDEDDYTTRTTKFKAYLKKQYDDSTPIKIYYALETPPDPETIELPDITVLSNTIITIDTTVQPSKIEK